MLGWSVGVTAWRRDEEQIALLQGQGAVVLHGPMVTSGAVDGNAADLVRARGSIDRPDLTHAGRAAARRLVAAVAARSVDAVTFTSSSGVGRFVELSRVEDRFDDVLVALAGPVVTASIGPTCTEAIIRAGFAAPVESRSPRVDAMVEALAEHAASRRRGTRVGHVDLLLDASHPVVAGRVIEMGARERRVLDVLAHRPGVVVSKAALCREVWGHSTGLHTVEVTVARLRDRLASTCGQLLTITTVPRRGYRLVAASGGDATSSTAALATRSE